MNKGWLKLSRLSLEYEARLQKFLDFIIEKFGDYEFIQYSCKKCMSGLWLSCQDVNDHFIIYGFIPSYKIYWDQHSECRP